MEFAGVRQCFGRGKSQCKSPEEELLSVGELEGRPESPGCGLI